jgi:hypothetical protein
VCQSKICPYPPPPPTPNAINGGSKDLGCGLNFSDLNGEVKYFFKSLEKNQISI